MTTKTRAINKAQGCTCIGCPLHDRQEPLNAATDMAEKLDARALVRELVEMAGRYDPEGPDISIRVGYTCGGDDIVDALLEAGGQLEIESAKLQVGRVDVYDQRNSRPATEDEIAEVRSERAWEHRDDSYRAVSARPLYTVDDQCRDVEIAVDYEDSAGHIDICGGTIRVDGPWEDCAEPTLILWYARGEETDFTRARERIVEACALDLSARVAEWEADRQARMEEHAYSERKRMMEEG